MNIETRREALKAKIDLITCVEELAALETIAAGLVLADGSREVPRWFEITDDKAAEYERRIAEVRAGGGVSQEEMERRYGAAA